jgi:16S rRNA (cytosine967-C5)-methyltransferase
VHGLTLGQILIMTTNIRALAAQCVFTVVEHGKSLSEELPKQQLKATAKDKGLLQELCYGVLRYLPELEYDVRLLMQKPLIGKQRLFHFLILVGIYQFKYTRIPDHATVGETVAAAQSLKNKRLKGLINGVLRNFQRQQAESSTKAQASLADPIKYNHPGWFIKKIRAAYPNNWQSILSANQNKPPMWLRVNQQHHSVAQYIALLEQAEIEVAYTDSFSGAIQLKKAQDVNNLPGFAQGFVSVQDGAAQQAALILNSKAGDSVLDCCAAPGGKTCHILEITPNIKQMTAIDIEQQRLVRVTENLARLNLNAKVIAGDAGDPQAWWDKQLFDRILLDAPCSGTGVIRRHPDIKWLRKASDIATLTQLQRQIISSIWPLVKPGGILVYATCSILPEENSEQIQHFLANNQDAELVSIVQKPKQAVATIGWQILPNESLSESSMDGFYYAKIKKLAKT